MEQMQDWPLASKKGRKKNTLSWTKIWFYFIFPIISQNSILQTKKKYIVPKSTQKLHMFTYKDILREREGGIYIIYAHMYVSSLHLECQIWVRMVGIEARCRTKTYIALWTMVIYPSFSTWTCMANYASTKWMKPDCAEYHRKRFFWSNNKGGNPYILPKLPDIENFALDHIRHSP